MERRVSNPRKSGAFSSRRKLAIRRQTTASANGVERRSPRANPHQTSVNQSQSSQTPEQSCAQLNGSNVKQNLFKSFFAAGFECSTHLRRSGWRLDLIHSTAHDQFAELDYQRLDQLAIKVTREGVRWHLVEQKPGRYDFSSALPAAAAARTHQTQVVWDLCHFGWPDHLDLFSPAFVRSLADYGAHFVQWLIRELDAVPFIVPVNEISFFSWASADEGSMYPFITGRGFELKRQLVRASIETIKAIRSVAPQTRFIHVDPIIHVAPHPKHPEEIHEAEAYRQSQYQAWDMLRGAVTPDLAGGEEFLDIIGVNFYPHNQWLYNLRNYEHVRLFQPISQRSALYRPLRDMLVEVHQRFHRPIWIAETGAESRRRAGWLRYVCEQARDAILGGVPLEGICLYPILNHPGWVDDRHCHNGLWDYADASGNRPIYQPLARELSVWQKQFNALPLVSPDHHYGTLNALRAP